MRPPENGDARLLEFKYNARVASMSDIVSKRNFELHAANILEQITTHRPKETPTDPVKTLLIILIAHGFGGLICEAALTVADNERRSIIHLIKGIILLNTPHYRANIAEWATMSAQSIGLVKKVKQKVWEGLKEQFDGIVSIQDAFRELLMMRNKGDGGEMIWLTSCFDLQIDPAQETMLSPEWVILSDSKAFGIHRDRFPEKPSLSGDQEDQLLTAEIRGWLGILTDTRNQLFVDILDEAAKKGHEKFVKVLCSFEPSLDKRHALRAATEKGHERVVRTLREIYPSLDRSGALDIALGKEDKSILQALLDKDDELYTPLPLQAASLERDYIKTQALLQDGADVNGRAGYYGTALHVASDHGYEEIVQLLLDHGADVNSEGNFHGPYYRKRREGGVTPLYIASCKGYGNVVKILVNRGANVNAEGGDHGIALQAASFEGHEKVVKIPVERGADVNAEGRDLTAALHAASLEGDDREVQELLLQEGIEINARCGPYGSALEAASYRGHERIVRLLINNNADVNKGIPLRHAAEQGYKKIVQMLLDSGARRALDYAFDDALMANHMEIAQLLRDYEAQKETFIRV